ncbi:hypothetical protein [Cuspidothrix issatschenkoi]|uniref:Uncharacterized protein n=1 Tax=Cuspidothrix issatschenkoi CHARLIE-1 TaxID=2052836 RepID=A0A2S6CP24_9CYAN|nr:hypothetical protein [Cuspidothrix issatschenkoi]PPJ61496.1 hypothetical protein CUN59_20610 [Cuspidothrix issatschenkoi CHARLIE-1]
MLQLMDGYELTFETSEGVYAVSKILTASDIKKAVRENGTSYTEEVSKLDLVGYDDNGNAFYI